MPELAAAQALHAAAAPDLWLFFLMVAGIIALPGMDMAFVAGSALAAGLRGGLAAVAGIVAGGLVHVAVAASGVAALWLAWPAGFNALLLAGAAYMAWIGWSLLRVHDAGSLGVAADAPRRGWAIFRRGALTCLLNPKAYAFMLAVFPAFMAAPGRSMLAQSASLSAVIACTQIAVYGAVAVAAASAGHWGAGAGTAGRRARLWATRGVGLILLLGAAAAPLMAWRSQG
ncbi:LysE family translocator [Aquabacterium sp. OR-4]|uniref:LysE family translocator n=1 Tax=Aquabacterium sp. OR-4 TaxID=2978127 RepID=UPI0021B363F0|nr:LysE family translocator [Aquabacterium sp. OR-4]MDT7837758.1 LysE family translocator [Aquabacterium sp. OR-4]